MASHYEASGWETECEAGSRRRVLRNLQGIRSTREMARAESNALIEVNQQATDETGTDQRFCVLRMPCA